MKRYVSILLMSVMAVFLSACGEGKVNEWLNGIEY